MRTTYLSCNWNKKVGSTRDGITEEVHGSNDEGMETKERSEDMRIVVYKVLKLAWAKNINDYCK